MYYCLTTYWLVFVELAEIETQQVLTRRANTSPPAYVVEAFFRSFSGDPISRIWRGWQQCPVDEIIASGKADNLVWVEFDRTMMLCHLCQCDQVKSFVSNPFYFWTVVTWLLCEIWNKRNMMTLWSTALKKLKIPKHPQREALLMLISSGPPCHLFGFLFITINLYLANFVYPSQKFKMFIS